ncbi:hypothetical protein Dxin01_01706 [Deinococcus xinjiangensis]|uniref:Uncharacterized protein n=1 Tax=Deinococcus xinjiangensis TaxID=457454 RepID=A0ABP9VE28_9DEIO
MTAARWLLMLLLVLLGLGLSFLMLGAYGNMVSDAPLWLRSVGSIEGMLSGKVGDFGLSLFARAILLTLVASLMFALAAYVKPRA